MFEKRMKKIDAVDIGLIKLGMVAFTLFLITVWPAAMNWVHSVHWGWFLGVALVILARPYYRAYLK